MKNFILCFLLGLFSLSSAAQSLTTIFSGGNSQDGNMFDVKAKCDLTIVDFDLNLEGFLGTIVPIEVYYKAGSHVGFENDPTAWTLHAGPVSVISNGPGIPSSIGGITGIDIPANTTYSFYITAITNPNFDYTNGSAVGNIAASNADMEILEGTGNAYPFGSVFNPRIWNGTIYYTKGPPIVVPTLGQWGIMCLLLLLLIFGVLGVKRRTSIIALN